jgi:hypothetical protein
MTEKYYLVSENELINLKEQSVAFGMTYNLLGDNLEEMEKAETTCRTRPADKLMEVVEAAKVIANFGYSIDGTYLVDHLRELLDALEEKV